MKNIINFSLFTALLFSVLSCTEAENLGRSTANEQEITNPSGVVGDGSGNGATSGDENSLGEDETTSIVKVEIRHLIEPKIDDDSVGGDYKRKMTIPKNYNGLLYLAGINISTLSDKNIKVRFNFGTDSSPKEIDATVQTAAGLTPQTNVEVLVMDLRGKDFEDVQLNYDLYDYNSYDFSGVSDLPGVLSEPVSHNRDDKLFCRGLSLKDDSTFSGDLASGCKSSDDVCKYAYAKAVDKTLVEQADETYYVPSQRNIQAASVNYADDTDAIKIARCLPDQPFTPSVLSAYQYDASISFATFGSIFNIPVLGNYVYNGPYFASDTSNWHISSEALKSEYGVFAEIFDVDGGNDVDDNELQFGYQSKLFPLYTKFDLAKDTEYMGSVIPNDPKTAQTMAANGESLWLDGCNERVSTIHNITGESVGSCNVTATIEIVATDDSGVETIIDITDEVKLQLVKPATLNTSGENVLLSSFQSCSSTNQCGSGSCCINKRCWSQSLVSQCIEDLPNYGNAVTGAQCTSDYQCASLCCDKTSGRCAPHDTTSQTPSYCSKPTGQSCIAKEWCQKHPVQTCAIVLGPNDAQGGITCSLRCVTAEVFGECVASDGVGIGQCQSPATPEQPVFNTSDPNRCNDAITFEQLEELARTGS